MINEKEFQIEYVYVNVYLLKYICCIKNAQ